MSSNWDHIVVKGTAEPLPDPIAGMASLERALGCALAPDYRDFLIATNGGEATLYYFEFSANNNLLDDYVTLFLHNDIYDNNPCGIMYMMKLLSMDALSNAIPIANTLSDHIYLITQGPRQGQVWIQVRDLETVESPGPHRVFLANSFKEFCDMLREDPFAS
ncbi:MAG: SMI1/KNR4 family protein [Phycisphaeraceae bacterium]|nr:SMI1/KNR4 family protein [Phycisphaeraceae bacterium]MBX3367719.1 SMI1/KNR4 family protein [Phycisphaeraceae bacterium]